jgi:hypothetical protein
MGRTSRGEDVAGGAAKRVIAHLAARLCRQIASWRPLFVRGITARCIVSEPSKPEWTCCKASGTARDEGAWLQLGVGVNEGVSVRGTSSGQPEPLPIRRPGVSAMRSGGHEWAKLMIQLLMEELANVYADIEGLSRRKARAPNTLGRHTPLARGVTSSNCPYRAVPLRRARRPNWCCSRLDHGLGDW